ncbi:hypothetical protein LOZ65_004210 [Ophidiomyces ophidiicola]|nr:hypothetical protein LOZ65_004210 [Ophidiomyces ophidiicola]
MAEVIDLLSSPEPEPLQSAPRPCALRQLSPTDKLISDIFGEATKPSKRQKANSSLGIPNSRSKKAAISTDSILNSILGDDLSDIDPCFKFRTADWAFLDSFDADGYPMGRRTSVTYHKRTFNSSNNVIVLDSDCEEIEDEILQDPFGLAPSPPTASQLEHSGQTSRLLAKLREESLSQREKNTAPKKQKRRASVTISDNNDDDDDDVDSTPVNTTQPKQKRPKKAVAIDKNARALEREAAKLRREKEKEEAKERKRLEKEEKERAKKLAADIAQANKSKVNKRQSTAEMMVDMSLSFEESSVGNQVGEFMHRLEVPLSFISTQIPNMVTWRRKVIATYNDEVGHWEPCPPKITKEDHVLCFLPAKEFVGLVLTSEPSEGLDAHYQNLMQHYPQCKPIYLIEGLTAWMRKNQSIRNRAYQAAVLRQMGTQDQSSRSNARTRKPNDSPPPVDDDTIEDALLQLQMREGCLIYHTATPAESAEWIKNFTEHISTIPYRQQRMNTHDAGFCMDIGQVKCGADADDTYIKMLEEINRVTAPTAYGIAMEYRNIRELVNGVRQCGPLGLQDVRKCANKSGALTAARIGPAMSRRLYKIFTSSDATSMDI